jgi:hypothetical protein
VDLRKGRRIATVYFHANFLKKATAKMMSLLSASLCRMLGTLGFKPRRVAKSRSRHQARDHDLEPDAKLMPFGIHRPDTAETWLSFTTGSTTVDFMVDRLSEIWPML